MGFQCEKESACFWGYTLYTLVLVRVLLIITIEVMQFFFSLDVSECCSFLESIIFFLLVQEIPNKFDPICWIHFAMDNQVESF